MKFLRNIFIHLAANLIAILAADYFIPGFSFKGNFIFLLWAASVITGLNIILKPILKLFLGPFIVLTFGLLIFVINAALLLLATFWAPGLVITGWIALAEAAVLFFLINFAFGFFLGKTS